MSSKANTEAIVKPQLQDANAKLMAKLGIKTSQIDTTKVSTKSRSIELNTNQDKLKHEARQTITKVNEAHGSKITFQCFQRDGKTKEGEPKFKIKNMSGFWTLDKTKDGLFTASRVHYYTETFTIADYKE